MTATAPLPRDHVGGAAAPYRGGERSLGPTARLSLCALGLVLLGAWGGIVAFVGPTFGFRADGTTSWDLSVNHVLLYLGPGALAFLCGLLLVTSSRAARHDGGRLAALAAGIGAVVAGLWFVIGPVAWPVIHRAIGAGPFVAVPATPLANLVNQIGYNLGVGTLILALGAVAVDAALRQRRRPVYPDTALRLDTTGRLETTGRPAQAPSGAVADSTTDNMSSA